MSNNPQPILDQLWSQYIKIAPIAEVIHQKFEERGETTFNDHIALRTFNLPNVNIEKLSEIFIRKGYQAKGTYRFPNKHLNAQHFEHSQGQFPKIFISELIIDDCTQEVKDLLKPLLSSLQEIQFNESLLFQGVQWPPITYKTYNDLRKHSEYAAWLSAFGFCANHFTISGNHLKTFKNIKELNTFLKQQGYRLNNAGGEVKGSQQEGLEQSSTKAEKVSLAFKDGVYEIPSCYVEFAWRYPQRNGQLFQAFLRDSADKIFESTHPDQNEK